jgi:hypothetical protein
MSSPIGGDISEAGSKKYLLRELQILEGFDLMAIIFTFNNPLPFGPKRKLYTGNYEMHETGSINFDFVVSKKVLIDNKKKGQTIRDRILQLSQISLDSTNLKVFISFLKNKMR